MKKTMADMLAEAEAEATICDDDSHMPFGKYKGVKMYDIPASYLLWLLEQPFVRNNYRSLYQYIRDIEEDLRNEDPGDDFRDR